ncbi:helix-turn-helix domain-containing protein [Streptomyces sp. NPDC001922]|uniref:helix-turn-helix domain-containing protein n=1 Tax=Streptomyces sp. NPDC001922 TaxID=3364624 RepID=UPI0036CF68B1
MHRLFRQEEYTLAAFIRRRRLERIRHDLTDPTLNDMPINALAARWGFLRATDFSRAFRRTYGVPPRELRQRARSASSGHQATADEG